MSAESLEYQLVFQLSGSSQRDFEALIAMEEELRAAIGDLGTVDGHDMGSGEMNVFVLTARPIVVFERASTLPTVRRVLPRLKVAFRSLATDDEDFEMLHPPGLYRFEVT